MPKKLQKSLQDYISKIKKTNTPNIQSISSSKKWILSGCKHPKTPSFAINHDQNEDHNKSSNNGDAATLSDINRFLFENFKSLYITNDDEEYYHEKEGHDEGEDNRLHRPNDILFESSEFVNSPPNLHESHPFFVTPGRNGLIIEEAESSMATTSDEIGSSANSTITLNDSVHESKDVMLSDECIVVVAYSLSPYEDFRRSMQAMIEEKLRHDGKVYWDFMEEILFCYLNLNEKKSHKFILSAFADLIVVLRRDSENVGGRSRSTRSHQNATERRKNVR